MGEVLAALGEKGRSWTRTSPWTNVYGVGRSLMALATLLSLLANPLSQLFSPSAGFEQGPTCTGLSRIGIFCVVDDLRLAWIGAIVVLLAVISGWRPQVTGVAHWWVAMSFDRSATLVDGGDQIAANVALLLIPLTLTDPRKNHWMRPSEARRKREDALRLIGVSSLTVVAIQVAGIYFHSAMAKFGVAEWVDGTAMYYWLHHPVFGLPEWVQPVGQRLLANPFFVSVLTWTPLVVELCLAAGILLRRQYWRPLLALGLALHGGIAVFMGLIPFAMVMWGALIIFLRPPERPFALRLRARRATRRAAAPSGAPIPVTQMAEG